MTTVERKKRGKEGMARWGVEKVDLAAAGQRFSHGVNPSFNGVIVREKWRRSVEISPHNLPRLKSVLGKSGIL